jgi:hypothetical protein
MVIDCPAENNKISLDIEFSLVPEMGFGLFRGSNHVGVSMLAMTSDVDCRSCTTNCK